MGFTMTIDEEKLQQMLDAQSQNLRSEWSQALDSQSKSLRADLSTELDLKLEQKLELKLAKFYGQMSRHFDKRFDKFETKIDNRVNDIYNRIDGFLGRMTTDETERAAMNNQLNRHDNWIHELAGQTGTTLSAP